MPIERRIDIIINLYGKRSQLVAIAFRYLRNREKAEDVVSDTFEYLLKKKDTLADDRMKIYSYLLCTLKHKCLNELRKDTARQQNLEDLYDADCDLLADDNVSRNIIERDIAGMLGNAGIKVDRQTFDIYMAARFDGVPHKELADRYGITVNKVAKQVMAAGKVIEAAASSYLKLFPFLLFMVK